MVMTRVAPSPTGDPHIGTAYSALFNYAFAKKNRGKFILRIEDTDRTRLVTDSEKKIIELLRWLGIIWDGKLYRQSERLEIYKDSAKKLVERGAAYYCTCSPERLREVRSKQQKQGKVPCYDKKCRLTPPAQSELTKGSVVRLKVPERGETSFEDVVRGKVTFKNKEIDDAVLLKSDGWPTYHLAVVVDDTDMEVTHVMRAEEWLSSTPKHILLYNAFEKNPPVFAHLPLLRNPDRSKISKRKNPVSLVWYKREGFLPEAILNYLGLMGWSMPDGREKFSLTEFVENFDLGRVDPSGPVFDLQKLEWLNGEWIRSLPSKEIALRIKDYTRVNTSNIEKVLPLVQERLKKLSEFDQLTAYFFQEDIDLEKDQIVQKKHDLAATIDMLGKVEESLASVKKWNKTTIERILNKNTEDVGWTKTDLFQTIRYVETGSRATPPLPETLGVIGRERVLRRIRNAAKLLSQ